jgi:hypothetical protein
MKARYRTEDGTHGTITAPFLAVELNLERDWATLGGANSMDAVSNKRYTSYVSRVIEYTVTEKNS